MKFSDIYDLAIEMGKNSDPRGTDGVQKVLAAAAKEYDKLDENKKVFFMLVKTLLFCHSFPVPRG